MTITIRELWVGFSLFFAGRVFAVHTGYATFKSAFNDISIVGFCLILASLYAAKKL